MFLHHDRHLSLNEEDGGMNWFDMCCFSYVFLIMTNRLTSQENFQSQHSNLPVADFSTFLSSSRFFPIMRTPSSQKDNTSCKQFIEVRSPDVGHLTLNLSKCFECLAWALLHCQMRRICEIWETIILTTVLDRMQIQHRQPSTTWRAGVVLSIELDFLCLHLAVKLTVK